MSDWKLVALDQVGTIIGGGTPSSKVDEYWSGDVPWVTPKDLSGYSFRRIKRGNRNISKLGLAKSSARLLPKNSVLITSRAPIGYVAIADNEITTNQGFKSLVLNEGYHPEFIYYLIKHNVPKLEAVSSGSTFKEISGRVLGQVELRVPPIVQQEAIAHILGALDDKIELNRQMNATLEAMAQALFKSWFVDFDPVIDNALAAGNSIPEPLQARAEARKALGDKRKPLPETIQQQFPSSFVFSEEMGWVPEGWEVKSLGDIVELAYGKSLPATKRIDGDIPVFGSGGISGFHNEKLVDGPGIIVGRKGTVGSLYWVEDDFFPIDTVFYVVNKLHAPLYWLYQMLGTIDIKSMGADSAVPGVNRNALYARGVTIPNAGVFDGYLNQIESYNSQRKILDGQTSTISKLRDTLLPKLLSGQLRIPDAEKQIAEAI